MAILNFYIMGDCHADIFVAAIHENRDKIIRYPDTNRGDDVFVVPQGMDVRFVGATLHNVVREFPPGFFKPSIGDTVIYIYGELDCRVSIPRQLEKGRTLDEVVEDLAKRYVEWVLQHKVEHGTRPIISCVIPPSDVRPATEDVGQQIGTRAERVLNTKSLNAAIKAECELHNVLFLDFYDHYALDDGSLNQELAAGRHIGWTDNLGTEIGKLLESNKDGWDNG